MNDIYQTTNNQPWVEALAAGLIDAKTRTSKPHVKPGTTVFLHSSKTKLWKDWKGLKWISKLSRAPEDLEKGMIVAIATVKEVGLTEQIMSKKDKKFWDVHVKYPTGSYGYNSCAEWTVRFSNIKRLKVPVAVKGMLAPYAKAKPQTIALVKKLNPDLALEIG